MRLYQQECRRELPRSRLRQDLVWRQELPKLMAGNAQECKMTRKEALDWLVDIIKVEGVEINGSERDWLARRSLPLLLSPPTSAISAVNSSAFIRPTSQYS